MEDKLPENPVYAILAKHDQYASTVQKDVRYSDVGKQELIKSSFESSRHDAIATAEKLLDDAAQSIAVAQAKHNQASAEWANAVDPNRQLLANQRIDSLTYIRDKERGPQQLETFVEDAIRTKDIATLRAFDQNADKLIARVQGMVGAPPFTSSQVGQLQRRAQAALANLEPQPLKESRQAVQSALSKAKALESDLFRINERWSRNGGPGPLRSNKVVVKTEVYDTAPGKQRITVTGDWF